MSRSEAQAQALQAMRQTLLALQRDITAALDHVAEVIAELPPPPPPAQPSLPLWRTMQ